MMEVAAVMHCSSSLLISSSSVKSGGSFFTSTTNRHNGGGLKLKAKESCQIASVSSSNFRGGAAAEFTYCSPRSFEWQTLHLLSPPPSAPSRRRVNSVGQQTINTAQPAITDEKALLIEEEQKLLLKRKAAAIHNDLKGTSILLVGMMGSGKTTVGKRVAEALGYLFFDSDNVVEDTTGVAIKQMFKEGREEEFRNAESEVIMELSSRVRVVVSTGGGAVVRPQNWGYLRQGITVWLDVPLEALAARVVAVGCESRPLLGQVSPETAYEQALNCLENLFEEREGYYKNADASVCVAALAKMMGLESVSGVTPTMLAVQVLEEIAILIRNRKKRRERHDRLGNL
ncbi:unnamed protein product [Calypogeia fissa]